MPERVGRVKTAAKPIHGNPQYAVYRIVQPGNSQQADEAGHGAQLIDVIFLLLPAWTAGLKNLKNKGHVYPFLRVRLVRPNKSECVEFAIDGVK